MATTFTRFEVDQAAINGNVGTLYISFTTPVNGLELKDFVSKGVTLSNLASVDNVNWTATVTPNPGFVGRASIILWGNSFTNAIDRTGGSGEIYYFTISPPAPVVTFSFESTGSDAIYNADEVGPDGTITAKIHVSGAVAIGDILTAGNIKQTIDQNILDNGFEIQVVPGGIVTALVYSVNSSLEYSYSSVAPRADVTPPNLTISSNSVTEDNIISASEAGEDVVISGTIITDGADYTGITVSFGGNIYNPAITETGAFSVAVPASLLISNSDRAIEFQGVARDSAGNTAYLVHRTSYDVNIVPASAAIYLDPVAEDNYLSLSEITKPVKLSGRIVGEYDQIKSFKLIVGEKAYDLNPDQDGRFVLEVSGQALYADADKTIEAEAIVGKVGSEDAVANTKASYAAGKIHCVNNAIVGLDVQQGQVLQFKDGQYFWGQLPEGYNEPVLTKLNKGFAFTLNSVVLKNVTIMGNDCVYCDMSQALADVVVCIPPAPATGEGVLSLSYDYEFPQPRTTNQPSVPPAPIKAV